MSSSTDPLSSLEDERSHLSSPGPDRTGSVGLPAGVTQNGGVVGGVGFEHCRGSSLPGYRRRLKSRGPSPPGYRLRLKSRGSSPPGYRDRFKSLRVKRESEPEGGGGFPG